MGTVPYNNSIIVLVPVPLKYKIKLKCSIHQEKVKLFVRYELCTDLQYGTVQYHNEK